MYQLDEIYARREQRQGSIEARVDVRSAPAHRNGTSRSDTRLRVVRVPGGFAFVEDRPATGSN